MLNRLEPQEVEAVLAHGLAHIANRDALVWPDSSRRYAMIYLSCEREAVVARARLQQVSLVAARS